MRRIVYNTNEERALLLENAKMNGEYLIEDVITIDGKYLIFDAMPLEPEPQLPSLDERLGAVELVILDLAGI